MKDVYYSFVRSTRRTTTGLGLRSINVARLSWRTWWWSGILFLSLLILFVDSVVVAAGSFQSRDRWVAYRAWELVGTRGVRVLEAPSLIGISAHASRDFSIGGVLIVATLFLILWRRHYRWSALTVCFATAGAILTVSIVKTVVVRSGPPLTPWTPAGHSFPSGTAAGAVAFFGSVALLAHGCEISLPKRWLIVGLSSALATMYVASSLTFHYPSEVLGGVAVGIGWLAIVALALWPAVGPELSASRSDTNVTG